jgi:hypothetical protein
MKVHKTIEFLRLPISGVFPVDIPITCSATITKHFGRLEVSGFESALPLNEFERERAEEELIERANQLGFIPEHEPDAKRPH